jgi:hypothetical protein
LPLLGLPQMAIIPTRDSELLLAGYRIDVGTDLFVHFDRDQ